MSVITTAADAAWRVLLAGLVFGAGLPALFAAGMFCLSFADPATRSPNLSPTLARTGAVVCFGVVVATAITGLLFLMKATIKHYFGLTLF